MTDSVCPNQTELEALSQELGALLAERGWRMATAESCTGGWIAQVITAIAGSSGWFEGGLVTYSDAAKTALLGVPAMTIANHGAVSTETALAMVQGAVKTTAAEVAVAVTGIAGPGGGSADKPVGTVCFGFIAGSAAPWTERQCFPGDRQAVRAATVDFALRSLIARLG